MSNLPEAIKLLHVSKTQIEAALPKHIDADRIIRIASTEVRNNYKLLECKPHSVLGSIMQASQLGLEIGSGLGQAYLIPFKDTATLIIGYQGLIELVYRSGKISSLNTFCVSKDDLFDYGYDTDKGGMYLKWKPSYTNKIISEGEIVNKKSGPTPANSDNTILVVACAKTKDGSMIYEVMSKEEINKIQKDNQKGSKLPDTWRNNWAEMAKKTVIRRIYKKLPKSVEMADAYKVTNIEAVGDVADYTELGIAVANGEKAEDSFVNNPILIDAETKEVTKPDTMDDLLN